MAGGMRVVAIAPRAHAVAQLQRLLAQVAAASVASLAVAQRLHRAHLHRVRLCL